MLAQKKTVVLIKEAIKLAFFRLVEDLEHQHLSRRPATLSRLFTVGVETGVCGYYLMKLPVEVL